MSGKHAALRLMTSNAVLSGMDRDLVIICRNKDSAKRLLCRIMDATSLKSIRD